MQFLIVIVAVAAYLIVEQVKKQRKKKYYDDNVIDINPNENKKPKLKVDNRIIWGVVIGVVVIFLLTSSIYTVDQTEFAVLTTFGRPSGDIVESGLKFKLPYPIQNVHKLSKETFSLTLGYKERENQVQVSESESKMITGDENIILADLEVQWKIVDPIAFLYSTSDPKTILFNATSSSLRTVIGSSTVDDALTDGRTKIINDIRQNLIELTNHYNLGISIINVNLQDVDLPTSEVDAAFKSVTDAREERITKINEANKYRNEKINQVEGEQSAILSKAEGEKISVIEKAKGDVAQFNAIYSEYKNNPSITRHRLTIQAIELAFKEARVIIVDDSGNTVKYLPIDDIIKKGVN
ncbi:FtsH protease activity modulator HflK [Proteiniborus sp. MB09-C3]|uniref:FtsH protease activity modulator HflK n=1 Tax=Proteiniborus sp. MB09-C3 TaxID=3050072 RepID=UPI00255213AB|nr:FtsH protease activity modulator HflK [Proteiniborus sp. MB09-C3]WIV11784.1 FtsH protease activity modulator HflK [Proteiniborus sp. MB09-C3]